MIQCKNHTIWNVLILLLGHNTSWRKHVMEKHVLSEQTAFLSGQNLSLAGQMTCLLTKIICRLVLVIFVVFKAVHHLFYLYFLEKKEGTR